MVVLRDQGGSAPVHSPSDNECRAWGLGSIPSLWALFRTAALGRNCRLVVVAFDCEESQCTALASTAVEVVRPCSSVFSFANFDAVVVFHSGDLLGCVPSESACALSRQQLTKTALGNC